MGTRSFPAGDGALVYSPSGVGAALVGQPGTYVTIYTDAATTVVATGLTYPDGTPVVDGRLLVDSTSRLPRFQDPAGRLVLYSKPDGSSVVTALYADSEDFIAQASSDFASRLLSILSVSGATYLTDAALGKVVLCSGAAAAYMVTLPSAVGITGETIRVQAADTLTKLVTVDGAGVEKVGAGTSVTLWAGEAVTLVSDGSNWLILNRTQRPLTAGSYKASSQNILTATVTQVVNMTVDYDPSGLMNFGQQIQVVRPGLYRVDVTTMWSATTAGANYGTEIRINGVTLLDINHPVTASGFPAASLSQQLELVAGDVLTIWAIQSTGATQAIYGHASGRGTRMALTEVL